MCRRKGRNGEKPGKIYEEARGEIEGRRETWKQWDEETNKLACMCTTCMHVYNVHACVQRACMCITCMHVYNVHACVQRACMCTTCMHVYNVHALCSCRPTSECCETAIICRHDGCLTIVLLYTRSQCRFLIHELTGIDVLWRTPAA